MKNSDKISQNELDRYIDSLNPDEYHYLLEMINNDSDEMLEALWSADYEEIPVSIEEFITNRDYLGNTCLSDEDVSTIYPFWHDQLNNYIFNPDYKIWELAFSGCIGSGKTSIAVIVMAYNLYKLLCLRDPASFYKLSPGSSIAIAFFSLSIDQVFSVSYTKLQNHLMNSPWFLRHGSVLGRTNHKTYHPDKGIVIVVGSRMEHFIGKDIFCAFMDEIDYASGSSLEEQSKMMKMYSTIKRRMESRYMKLGSLPGMLILVSSKNSEDNFLEQYINENRGKSYLHIVDEPLWVVKRDSGNYSGKTFNLAVGNKYRASHILSDDENPEVYENYGQRVIQVPVEHREAFEQSMNQALTDIAGIALASHSKYLVYDKIKLMYRDYLVNPVSVEILELGFDDDSQIMDFMIENKMSKLSRSRKHYIHWDTSLTGDKSGVAMTTTVSSKKVRRIMNTGDVADVNDTVHKIVFAFKIKAKPGEEIPFYKVRNFIFHLRDVMGYNIASISCDGFQSADTIQMFKLKGFNAFIQSVDRTRLPYENLKNVINEGRLIGPKIGELERELIEIEDDRKRNKIDHPIKSNLSGDGKGSKDLSDAVCGAIFAASKGNDDAKSYSKSSQIKGTLKAIVHDSSSDLDNMNISEWL